jgi:hypothetical protein
LRYFLAPFRHMTKFPVFVALQRSQIPEEWLTLVKSASSRQDLCHRVGWPVRLCPYPPEGTRIARFQSSVVFQYLYPTLILFSSATSLTISAELIPLSVCLLRVPHTFGVVFLLLSGYSGPCCVLRALFFRFMVEKCMYVTTVSPLGRHLSLLLLAVFTAANCFLGRAHGMSTARITTSRASST